MDRVCFNFKSNSTERLIIVFFAVSLIFMCASCAKQPHIAQPQQLNAPDPIADNSGLYMCPYTSDGVMAEWTDKAINAKMGSTIGSMAGAYAGQKALEQVPFVGGFIGQKVGEKIGREIAIKSCGGMEYIKETSDLSFNNVEEMSLYLYVKHSSHEHYQNALNAAQEIYPEFKKGYYQALVSASQ